MRWHVGDLFGGRYPLLKKGTAILGLVLAATAVAAVVGSQRSESAVPVPQTVAAATRATPGPGGDASAAGAAQSGPTKSHVLSHPTAFHLTRADSKVFDVRTLRGAVVKRERPEVPDPLQPGAFGTAASREAAEAAAAAAQPATVSPATIAAAAASAPPPDSSFDGLDFATWGAGHPPDTNGDVGPNYYIQTVNTSIGIYDKSNGNRVAAFAFNSFMSQGNFGNLCDTNNFGDPVVLYDTYENRWFITDFAFKLDASGNVSPQTAYQCFAVSKTGDPVSGGWNFYSILAPGGLGDYPKFGVWPDGIYMSANMFGYASGASYFGFHVWALNKQQMYDGAPSPQVVDFAGNTSDFTLIPANSRLQDGTPPAGSPEFFASTEQFLNALSIYQMHVDWDKVSTSTFTGPITQLAPNCWPNATPVNASTTANAADVLAIRAMAQAQYTNQGGAESLWVAHTVQRNVSATNTTCNATTGGNASVRWYQANVTGGSVAANVVQGATFDPDAANTFFRFMPALGVDRAGDMAVGYTKSNSTTNPQMKYAGRLSGDPVNTLGQGEQTLIDGTGSQSGNCGPSACLRWGDYSGMALDPNGCTFWETGEYYATTGLNDQTRIGSFHFPGCTTVGNGTLSGTVTDGSNPLAGVTVTLGNRTATTDVTGAYSFTVPAGTYPTETAAKTGFDTASASTLVVPDGGTLTKNFVLTASATSGCFTDNSQSSFQRGVPSATCDLTSSPGSVTLLNAPTVDQQNTAGAATGTGTTTNTSWAGQTFTAGVSGQLTKVDFTMFTQNCTSNPNLVVSIRATSGGSPTGADIASATIAGNNSGASTTFAASFASPPTLTSGTQYALIVRTVSSCGTGGYFWIRSSPSTYAGGLRVTSADSGATWTQDSTRDGNFHTYMATGFASSATFVSSLKDANPAPGRTATWSALTFSATTPAGTDVKFWVAASNSAYGPFNFVGPDGTTGTFFTTSGASLSQFDGLRYLRYEAFLSTTNAAVTPSLSSVQVCFQDVSNIAPTTLLVAPASGSYGGTATLSATLSSGGSPVPGESVAFTLNGNNAGAATTNASGVATLSGVSLAGIAAGPYPTGVGASFAGDSSFAASTGSAALTVTRADQTISVTTHAPTAAVFNTSFGVVATGGGSGNPVMFSSAGSCSNAGAMFTMTSGTGTCTVRYDQAGDTNYNPAPQVTETVNAQKADQAITVTMHAPSSGASGTGFTVAATGGGSGNPVTFSSAGSCTNAGASFTLTGSGVCSVMYDQAGDANYKPAPQVVETVNSQKLDQAISVTMHAPASAVFNTSFTVAATGGGSGNPVTFSSSGSCTNAGAMFTMTSGTGTCSVMYDQAGNANYNDAPQLTESVTAQKAGQAISVTIHAPASAVFNTSFTVAATGGGSGNPVTFSGSGSCSNAGAMFTITSGTGTCSVSYDQAGNANYNGAPQVTESVNAQKAGQAISVTIHAPASAVFNTSFTVAATGGGSGNPVTFSSLGSCSHIGATFTMTSGTGTCTVHYDQAGDGNYNAAPQVTESVNAQKADQSITFNPLAGKTYGDADFDPAATSSSGFAVSYSAAGSCSIVGGKVHLTGAGSCTVTASQAGNADFNPALTVPRTFAIARASLTITANDRTKQAGQTLALGTTAFSTSTMVGADSVASVTLTSAGAAAGAAPGPYPIVPSAAVAAAGTDLGNYQVAYVNGTLTVSPTPASAGLVGLDSASVRPSKGIVDSFDSSLGPYGPANKSSAASIVSNGAVGIGDVTVFGSVRSTQGSVTVERPGTVTGDITAGTTVRVDGTVNGTVTRNAPSTPVAATPVAACSPFSPVTGLSGQFSYNASKGDLSVNGGKTVTLANGTYCFHNVTLPGGAVLKVNGPVTIRLTGKLDADGGDFLNATNVPANLRIESSAAGKGSVQLSGGIGSYLKLYAPAADVTVSGGGSIFGAILGKTLTVSGDVAIHIDVQ